MGLSSSGQVFWRETTSVSVSVLLLSFILLYYKNLKIGVWEQVVSGFGN